MDTRLTILIAEDDENDLALLQVALRKAEITNPIQVCRDGAQVLSYLRGEGAYANRQEYPFPRLLILDLKMPKLTGLEVLRWVRSNRGYAVIPTIVLSNSKHSKDIQEAYELGANAYIVKPPGFSDLHKVFKNLIAFWQDCELPEFPGKPQ
jgi:CheY-like chemotaxis protein